MKLVVVYQQLTEKEKEQFLQVADRWGIDTEFYEHSADAIPHLEDADIIFGYGQKLFANAPNLKWFATSSAGVNLYLPLMRDGVILTNSTGTYGVGISEHVIMVSLDLMRRMPETQRAVLDGKWEHLGKIDSIYGSSCLIIGTGDIGTNIARRLKAFVPETIVGVNRSGKGDLTCFDRIVPVQGLDEELPKADLVVSCIPETELTLNLLNRDRVGLMKQGAYFVNVGRGSVVDDEALIEALNSGKLAGAALDVFRTEPLEKNSPFYSAKNLIITPHASGLLNLAESRRRNISQFLENLEAFCSGAEMKNVIDARRGY